MNRAARLGILLKEYRINSRDFAPIRQGKRLTQERLAELLEVEKGISRTTATISYWENPKKDILPDRAVLVALIAIFYRTGGLEKLKQADELLEICEYQSLTRQEITAISLEWLDGLKAVGVDTTLTPADMPQKEVPAPSTLPSGSRLPLTANPHFVGRENELRQLANELREGVTVAVGQTVAATGLGGIGKTQLAVEFAHRYGKYFPGGVFWFNFDQPEAIAGQIANTGGLGYLNIRPDFNELKLAEQLQIVQKMWLESTPRLLIFDGCEDEASLTKWRPPHGGCRIIITSRRGQWSSGLGVSLLHLGVLSRKESINLLQQLRSDLTQTEANDIAKELGDLPLALHLAGNFLGAYRYDVSANDYLTWLRELQGGNLLEHPSLKGLGTDFLPTSHEAHVVRTFALSYERLDPNNEVDTLAQALLTRASYLAPNEPIPRFLLQGSVKDLTNGNDDQYLLIPQAFNRLIILGLIREGEDGVIRLHQLIAEFMQGIRSEQDAQKDVEKAVLLEAERLDEDSNTELIQSWVSHLKFVTDKALANKNARTGALHNILGTYLRLKGEYAQAQVYIKNGLEVRQNLLTNDHPKLAESLNNWGLVLQEMGDYEEAESCIRNALSVRETVLGLNHFDTVQNLINLGHLLHVTGNYKEAKHYLKRALTTIEITLGPNHLHTAISLNYLGSLLQAMGDYKEARLCLERALTIRECKLGMRHHLTAESLNSLGILLHYMGDYAGAKPYYERALIIRDAILGSNHHRTATSLNNLGALLIYMGNYKEAKPYLKRAFIVKVAVLGPEHPDTANTQANLGTTLKILGEYKEAKPNLEQAVSILKMTIGEEHPLTASSMASLGHLLQVMGEYEGAKLYLEKALIIRETVLGSNHPETANSLNMLGDLLTETEDYEEAMSHLEQSLAIREVELGIEHPKTAVSLNSLGFLHKNISDLTRACSYLEKALTIRKKHLGANHPETAQSYNQLGHLLQVSGEMATARTYYEKALTIQEKSLELDHPDTADTLHKLGTLQRVTGNLDAAQTHLEQALAVREEKLGEVHQDTGTTLNELGLLYQAMGDLTSARRYFQRALTAFEKSLGPDHEKTQIVRGNLQELEDS